MTLNEMIYRRKSVRKYRPDSVDEATLKNINEFCAQIKPLYSDIKVRAEVLGKENVKCILPWITPQVIAVFSEEKDGYLVNAGFMFQQLDLYLQTLGLGSCWLGMGRLDSDARSKNNDDLKFVIMLAFGYPNEDFRSDVSQFVRRSLSDISDKIDERLEPARLAPSAVNSQPWYFTHEGEVIHVYCRKQGIFKKFSLGEMNYIDIGIALVHMYVSNPDTFRFFAARDVESIKNYGYIGSFTLLRDQ